MAGDEPDFLRRWSQRKQEHARREAQPPVPKHSPAAADPQPLPPVDSLNLDSDFAAFMHAKVEEGVKRAALKKLFADPRFNVMDGLDTYIDDYSKGEIMPDDMLATLEHAKSTLFGPKAEPAEAAADPAASAAAAADQTGAEPEPAPGAHDGKG